DLPLACSRTPRPLTLALSLPDALPIFIEVQEAAWQAMIADLKLAPLVLYYEDILAEPRAAIAAVAEFIGVEIDPAAEVDVPAIRRQSQEGARAWAERHQAVSRPSSP